MKTNFEIIKTAIYQKATESNSIPISVLLSRCSNGYANYFRDECKNVSVELNTWLDRIDIRQAGALIDFCNREGIELPKWLKAKRYYMDYNNAGLMDLIKLETN